MEEMIKIENGVLINGSADKLIEEINAINKYKNDADVYKNRCAEYKDEIIELEEKIDILNERIVDYEVEIEKLKLQDDAHKELIARLTNILADKKDICDTVSELRQKNIELETELNKLKKRESSQSKTINQLAARKKYLDEENKNLKEKLKHAMEVSDDVYKVNDLITAENALKNHAEIRILRENEIEVLKNTICELTLKFYDDVKKIATEDLNS